MALALNREGERAPYAWAEDETTHSNSDNPLQFMPLNKSG
jgi:hypothetical protein